MMSSRRRMLTGAFVAVLAAAGAGCGQKGDLFLPDAPEQSSHRHGGDGGAESGAGGDAYGYGDEDDEGS